MKSAIEYHTKSLLNSYAILFFSQNKVLGTLLLLVSFFNIPAGLTGLVCVIFALTTVNQLGFHRDFTHKGLYSFNALLFGLAFGMFYQTNLAFLLWLMVGCIITIVLSIILSAWLSKYNLPVLSIPFIITYWLVILATGTDNTTGLLPKDGLLPNQFSSLGSQHLFSTSAQGNSIFYFADLFFRALSAIIFQNNVIVGLIIAIGIFIHSRISFSLLLIGFFTACCFHKITGMYPDDVSYYHLGANFMMVSAAIGGFFLIPSLRSYLWAIISIPASFLLVNALTKLLGIYNLPVFSLPFCLITISLLYFFTLRITANKLQLTPIQHYSPEKNLYQYTNNVKRLDNLKYLPLNLPFMGEWTVSQGYNGDITHKDDWANALDFVITDEEQKTFEYPGTRPEHFYCFNKPVLACADGVVETVADNIEDNTIGQINTLQNWGNTVVIKHADDLYSKVSHLKKNSIKVKPGDVVKQGDQLALCGNSGRSPEPHLHFQLQLTPYIGSKTLKYPFADYTGHNLGAPDKYFAYSIPEEGMVISPVEINILLKQAFAFEPGYYGVIETPDGRKETWEVYKDAYNGRYLYSKQTGAVAYFVNNGYEFYFTAFYGDEKSLLYLFYLAAYRINFSSTYPGVSDNYPLPANKFGLWLHDIVAPFCQFVKHTYLNQYQINRDEISIAANAQYCFLNKCNSIMEAEIRIANNKLKTFSVKMNNQITEATWDSANN